MKILINLIGGQPAPNVIAFKEVGADKIVNVYSKESVKQHKNICISIGQNSSEDHIITDPFNYEMNLQLAEDILDSHSVGNELVLNFTGGTKIMSIAFVRTFIERGLRCIYIDSENHSVLEIDTDKSQQKSLNSRLTINEYFRIHGQEFEDNQINDLKSKIGVQELTDYLFLNLNDKILDLCKKSSAKCKGKDRSGMKTSASYAKSSYSLSIDAKNVKLIFKSEKDNRIFELAGFGSLKFFNGGWYEEKLYTHFKNSNIFDEVKTNVRIDLPGQKIPKNELDVVAIKDDTLYIFECKAGSVTQDSINKLRAIKELFGRYAKVILVSYFPVNQPVLLAKIREFKIQHIIFNKNITEMIKFISQAKEESKSRNVNL